MNKLTKILSVGMLASTLIMSLDCVEAFQPKSDFTISGGVRQDKIHTHVTANPATPVAVGQANDVSTDDLNYRNLRIWEVGLQGRLAMPEDCDCENWWLNNFFLKGYAYWGWVTDGDFDETITISPIGFPTTTFFDKGDADDGHTYDYSVGLGWLYPVSCEFGIGPVAGYAWDRQIIRTNHNRVHLTNKWTSPWLGFEMAYELCDCDMYFDAGYEYHWTRWHSQFINHNRSLNDTRRSNRHGSGHVAFFDAAWNYCECIDIIFGFRYTYFRTKGHESGRFPDGSLGGTAPVSGSVNSNNWRSYAVTIDLAYQF